jgi:hypothetical protein
VVILKLFGQLTLIKSACNAIKSIVFLSCFMLIACVQSPPSQQASTAQQALEQAIRAYEKGDMKMLEIMLPASFVGRDSLLDAARRAAIDQRSTRLELSDLQVQTIGASQALSMRWEKRFVRVSSGAAITERGTLRTVLRRNGDTWQFENLPADNLFTR